MNLIAAFRALRADAKERRISRRTRGSPDRRILVDEILPVFAERAGRILWIGCRRYTDDYPALLERAGGECWTTDIDPEAAQFGKAGRHRTGDMVEIDRLFDGVLFDSVLCNGVFGYGVDSAEAQTRAMAALSRITRPGALLLLGWNTDKMEDPVAAGVAAGLFTPTTVAGLPARRAIPDSTHVYDLFERTTLAG